MLEEIDIQRLIQVFATREEVATKADLKALRDDFNELHNAIDAYANKADTYFQEMVMLSHKVDRHDCARELPKPVSVDGKPGRAGAIPHADPRGAELV